jgi:hypothetical protein
MTETAMCWGCECGDGWYNLLDSTLYGIHHHYKHLEELHNSRQKERKFTKGYLRAAYRDLKYKVKRWGYKWFSTEEFYFPRLSQVKEKYGELCIYMWSSDDFTKGCIATAETLSGKVCEVCGSPGSLNCYDENGVFIEGFAGWLRCRCKEHIE